MLYYRTNKSGVPKFIMFLCCTMVWSSWFIFEIPLRELYSAKSPMPMSFSEGSVIVQTPSSSLESSKVSDEMFLEPAVGVLTSPFGERWGRVHEGIDVGGAMGSEIKAACDGTVLLSQWVEGYGNYIEIDHGNGYQTSYAHCQELYVFAGDVVSQGQCIATMGNTGNSTGPHLHFEILYHGEPQNPLDYVIY